MEFCTLCLITLFIVFLVTFALMDTDFTLKYYELIKSRIDHLRGDVIWITGASSGIGEYLAYEFAKAGCRLVLSARREDELQRVKNRALKLSNNLTEDDILVLKLDVLDYKSHDKAVATVLQKFDRLDILVNNAGRSQRGLAKDTDIEVTRQMMELNYLSVVSLTRAALPALLEKGRGQVACTSSVAGRIGAPNSSSYCGSKFALHGWFNTLRTECKGKLTVTLICPGPVHSSIVENAFTDAPDKKCAEVSKTTDRRMATERCAKMAALSIATGMDEAWMTQQPILLATYMGVYAPWITNRVAEYVMKTPWMQRIRQGRK